MFNSIRDTIKIIIGAAFVVFGIWDFTAPVTEPALINFVDALFVLLGMLFGAPALHRMVGSAPLTKVKDTVKVFVGAAFAVFAIWQLSIPVSEQVLGTLIDVVFALLAAIIGAPALDRLTASREEKLVLYRD